MNRDASFDRTVEKTVEKTDKKAAKIALEAKRLSRQLLMGGLGVLAGVGVAVTEVLASGPVALGAAGLSAAGVLQMLWALHRLGRLGPS